MVLYATILMSITSAKTANASEKQAIASELQSKAAEESIRAAVQPSLSFRIRPTDDYWTTNFDRTSWMPGVGVYIDSIGLGHAFNIKFKCRIVGEKEEHTFDISFRRMLVGERYTIPSKNYPTIEIKKTHKQIIIESIEYDDMRKPPNHYSNEPEKFNLYPEYFNEPNKQPNSVIL